MIPALLILLFFLSVVAACLFSGVEVALLAVNRRTLEDKLRHSGQDDHEIILLLSDTQRALAVTLVGTTAATLVGGLSLMALAERLAFRAEDSAQRWWVAQAAVMLAVSLVATWVIQLVAEVITRPLVRRRATEFLLALRGPLMWCAVLAVPLLRLCSRAAGWALRPFGVRHVASERPMTLGEIVERLGHSELKGPFDDSERDMIEGAIDLQSSSVREVMRPLVDVVAIKIPEATIASTKQTARSTGYSRLPVFRHMIIEMTEYVDVTRILLENAPDDGDMDPYVQPALIVPETMRIDLLLRTFLDRREQCAIVVDEYGSATGWVTREDVLEEIVGDIADKHADEEPGWFRDDTGVCHVDARMDLDDLNEQIGVQLVKGDDFDTLGGWIYARIGRIPEEGETIESDGVRVGVRTMDHHRILRATLEPQDEHRNHGRH